MEPLPDVVNLPEPGADPSKLSSFESADKGGASIEKEIAQEFPEPEDAETIESDNIAEGPQGEPTASSIPSPTPQQAATEAKMQQSGPMEAVLHIPPPESSHHPHISTPPYVHHFDSYSLVKELEAGGYSKDQAITVMKAIRGLLAQNLDVAQEGLVSKSDVDNVGASFGVDSSPPANG